jgi:serine/threonine protein phosphatase PrpC
MPYRFEFASRTDKGLVRATNEDAFGTLPDDGMIVVADGMGGYQAGEVASQLAVDTVLRHLNRQLDRSPDLEGWLRETEQAVEEANLAIWRAADNTPELQGMGTTVVIGVFHEDKLGFAWVGDSRLYRMRNGNLSQLTCDHTLVQELVSQGMFESIDEAKAAGIGDNVLTRALGAEEPVPVEVGSVGLQEGDLYMFCSDGLNHMVRDDTLEIALADPKLDLNGRADRMVELAKDYGGMDNITVVLAQVTGDSEYK